MFDQAMQALYCSGKRSEPARRSNRGARRVSSHPRRTRSAFSARAGSRKYGPVARRRVRLPSALLNRFPFSQQGRQAVTHLRLSCQHSRRQNAGHSPGSAHRARRYTFLPENWSDARNEYSQLCPSFPAPISSERRCAFAAGLSLGGGPPSSRPCR